MIRTEEVRIASGNKVNRLYLKIWIPEGKVRAVLQISHGMVEHIGRYREMAEYLVQHGILVAGNDHIGHGKTVRSAAEWGYFTPAKSKTPAQTVLGDIERVRKYLVKRYPSVPYFLLGHSMGSFFARAYTMEHTQDLDGVIFAGTGSYPPIVMKAAKAGFSLAMKLKGDAYRSRLMAELFFKSNNRKIKNPENRAAWQTTDVRRSREYLADELCQYVFTLNGYHTLLDSIDLCESAELLKAKAKKDENNGCAGVRVVFFCGTEDPVGNYGKAPRALYGRYRKMGCGDVKLVLFEGDRHEVFNERNRKRVYERLTKCLDHWIREIEEGPKTPGAEAEFEKT